MTDANKPERLAALTAAIQGNNPAHRSDAPAQDPTGKGDGAGNPGADTKQDEKDVVEIDGVPMTQQAVIDLVRLGQRVGSEDRVQELQALDALIERHPGIENVLRRLVADDGARKKLIEEYGKAPSESEDPKDKRIRELEAKLAENRQPQPGAFESKVSEAAKHYPAVAEALQGEAKGLVFDAIRARVAAGGQTLHQAIASVSKELGSESVRAKALKGRALGGIGVGGASPTTVTAPGTKLTGKDLMNGGVARALREQLSRRG